jgi:hypothetical protein
MTETATPVAKSVPRPRSRMAETVSASSLAQHFDCSRAYVGRLEAEGVIQRQGEGFPLDQSRVAYLRFLRRERRQSPRSEANADFQRAKAELIRLRVAEKRRELMPTTEHNALVDQFAGIVLAALGGLPARLAGADLAARRKAEAVIFELRREISQACHAAADQRGEPAEP